MPSSLAAALAASREGTTVASQTKDAPPKHSSSSLAQYQKKQDDNKPVHTQSKKNKQQTANQKSRKAEGGRAPQKNHQHRDDNHGADKIVFICNIPSSDEDECDEDEEVGLDTLQISDHKSSRRSHGGRKRSPNYIGGRGRKTGGRDLTTDNNDGRVLNVNASRRLIGHALGTRLGPPQSSRDNSNTKQRNDHALSNPGSMPTPWSKKAQELKNDHGYNCTERKTDSSKWEKNATDEQCSRVNHLCHISGNDKLSISKNILQEPMSVPKLESAKIKGRWADEDSSDDE